MITDFATATTNLNFALNSLSFDSEDPATTAYDAMAVLSTEIIRVREADMKITGKLVQDAELVGQDRSNAYNLIIELSAALFTR